MTGHPHRQQTPGAADALHGDRTMIGSNDDTMMPAGRLGSGHQWIGRSLGRYRLTAVLGGGGMGVVYRAHDEVIGRDVAVKVLPPSVASDATALARFLSEARASGKLSHPNVIALYEVGEQEGTHYLVMELVTGGSLAEEIRRIGPISPVAATRAIAEAARGLAAAHAAGMIHRDVKPANLVRSADGQVKVCDFGLAKETASEGGVTKAGHVIGTPYFMSPEQCQGKTADTRSDVYSLGATYFFLLTGVEPYADAGSTVQVMYAHCHGEPLDPRPLNSLVPDECATIVLKAAAKDPAARYASAGEMLHDLEGALGGMSGGRSGTQVQLGLSNADGMRLQPASQTSATQVTPVLRHPKRGHWFTAAGLGLFAAATAATLWAFRDADTSTTNPLAAASNGAVAASTHSISSTVGLPVAIAAVPAGEPIKVGVLHSLTGLMANSEAPVVDAVLLAIDEINEAGGVLGRPLEAVVADGRSEPAAFLREAERLIDTEKVAAVFGCWTSASRKTVVPLFEERDHLLVYPVQYEGLEESPNVFYTGATPNQQILPALEWATSSLGAKRFYIVGSDYVFPRAAAAIIRDAAPGLGIEIIGEDYLPLDARSAGASAASIAATKPDVILNLINGDTNVLFFNALRRSEVRQKDIPTISFSIGEDVLRRLDVSAVAGDYAAWSYFQSIDSPENAKFLKAFRKRYGPQRAVTDPMQSAYVGMKLWANAANEAAATEPRRVRQALKSQRMVAPEGPIRTDAESQHLYKTSRVGRIDDDGRLVVVWSADRAVAPEPYPATRSAEQWRAFLHDLQRGWGGRWAAPTE